MPTEPMDLELSLHCAAGFCWVCRETIIERRSREYVYETLHDCFVPFALATNLETIHDARHIIFRAPGIQEQPFDCAPRYMTL